MDWLIEPFALGFQQRALIGGALAAVALAVVGTWVVIRGMSFLGDALVHGVVPGIALAILGVEAMSDAKLLIFQAVFTFLDPGAHLRQLPRHAGNPIRFLLPGLGDIGKDSLALRVCAENRHDWQRVWTGVEIEPPTLQAIF